MRWILTVLLASCGAASNAPAQPGPALLTSDEMVALCEHLHHEVVSCAPAFVDLNLSLREAYMPGFAEQMRDPATRAAATAQGLEETKSDAEHAHERCLEFAKPAWGPAQPRDDLDRLERCYQRPDCSDKMACLRPLIEPRFAYRASHAAEH